MRLDMAFAYNISPNKEVITFLKHIIRKEGLNVGINVNYIANKISGYQRAPQSINHTYIGL